MDSRSPQMVTNRLISHLRRGAVGREGEIHPVGDDKSRSPENIHDAGIFQAQADEPQDRHESQDDASRRGRRKLVSVSCLCSFRYDLRAVTTAKPTAHGPMFAPMTGVISTDKMFPAGKRFSAWRRT